MKRKVAIKRAADSPVMSPKSRDQLISAVEQMIKNIDKIKPAAGSRASGTNIEARLAAAAKSKKIPRPPCPKLTCGHLYICGTNAVGCPPLLICGLNAGGCTRLIWSGD
jgi:hypothetical protein